MALDRSIEVNSGRALRTAQLYRSWGALQRFDVLAHNVDLGFDGSQIV